ncbi:FAD-dependent monooxygenase [Streptomyces sp. WMMC1477]|uniref:FAD-dependent monooxygenase n=1 Tax=Streptomyces sp. WMMC1477 TaxID=3015155 RepID=UPI0022B71021|nr:FAD-dependent monooxygenase [Streptomyces sp. WMMC1477]MCZ7433374.1 FAD-dependent monooxygenase [Streptomyces sp. WMMC1477]
MTASVIVVGAGPVGLSAALAAASLGLTPLVLEARRRDDERPGSRALFVHRATLRHLDAVSPGLGARVARDGLTWGTHRTLWAGREVHHRSFPPGEGPPPFTSLPQTALEDLLREACESSGIPVLWGEAVVRAAGRPGGALVRTASGAEHRAGHVIACDGPRSAVRAGLGVAMEGATTSAEFLVVDVDEGAVPAAPERVFHYRHPALRRNVLLVPFRGGWRIDVQCRPDEDAARLTGRIGDWLPLAVPHLRAPRVTWTSAYRFQQRVASAFTDPYGRVLLAGEAAHLLPPFGARGMNSGIADAVAAAHAVRDDAVRRYAHERRRAAHRNVTAAASALGHLLAPRLRQRVAQRTAALAAPLWPAAGRWLDAAPYGPRLRAVRY